MDHFWRHKDLRDTHTVYIFYGVHDRRDRTIRHHLANAFGAE